jgi:hypothetical protein
VYTATSLQLFIVYRLYSWTVNTATDKQFILTTRKYRIINRLLSESESLCAWWFTANQLVLATSPLTLTISNFFFQMNTCDYSPYVTSSLTRGWVCSLQLLLALASAVILSLSDWRFPQPGGPGAVIYIPQEKSGPVIPLSIAFPFYRLLRLAELRWR